LTVDLKKRHLKGNARNHRSREGLWEFIGSLRDDAAQVGVAEANDPVMLVLILPDQGGLMKRDPTHAPLH
jgi:hypothetical protein